MNSAAGSVLRRIIEKWDTSSLLLQRMYQGAVVRPQTAPEVLVLDEAAPDDEVKIDVGPVVFHVPERVGKGHQIYIALSGWLSFTGDNLRLDPMRTKSFGTQMAYFRYKAGVLEHIFGVHYDFDEELPGHPIFHAQMTSRLDLAQAVLDQFRLDARVENKFDPKLRTIRIPTSQVDAFAAIVQICGDHLVYQGADESVHAAFDELREMNAFIQGAAYRRAEMNSLPGSSCYRSQHWYNSEDKGIQVDP